ncbi:MAG: hypothetical protein JO362_03820 [Streptomycetaceae bacterium]|nr:hypothetical protein [Streptomycetaceae bacterium]
MEWINPEYVRVVTELRRRQADTPAQQCHGCKGRGEQLAPQSAGTSNTKCLACNGKGVRPAGLRSFIMT